MRNIKFRGWGRKDKKMITHIELGSFDDGLVFGAIGLDNDSYVEDFEWMQYTGLNDKNGKEIYEGDIVKGSNKQQGIIEWIKIDTCFAVQTYKKEIWTVGKFREYSGGIEVIGNVYENKDLLNEKE